MYKVIVAGSRDFSAPFNMELAGVLIPDAIEEFKVPLKEVEIVSGTARGADMMG